MIIRKLFLSISLVVTIAGLILAYYVSSIAWQDKDPLFSIVNFFSYFTIQSNIHVFISIIAMLFIKKQSKWLYYLYFITLVNILFTVIGYWIFLSFSINYMGIALIANLLIHLIIPIFFLVDWFLVNRINFSFKVCLIALIYPLSYLAYTLIRGSLTEWYPYYFLDLTKFPISIVLAFSIGGAFVVLIISAILVSLTKIASRKLELKQ